MAYKIKSYRKILEKARRCQVEHLGGRTYRITSPTSGREYVVNTNFLRCECDRDEWIGQENGHVNLCAHVQAALIYEWLELGYWLVARAEDADVANLKRKLVEAKLADQAHGDGVKFTARRVTNVVAEAKLARFEAGPVEITDAGLRDRVKLAKARYGA